MAARHLIVGAILIALGGVALAITLLRSSRLRRNGPRIVGTVVEVHKARSNPFPPYMPEPPRVRVRYELGGEVRDATLWMYNTKIGDYQKGQTLTLMVSRGLVFPRVRTASEANFWSHGGPVVPSSLAMLLLFICGAISFIWGIVEIL